jgi:hypothetical protein
MDRKNLTRPFSIENVPDWTCPTCGNGSLLVLKDSFHKDERLHSRDHSDDAFDPDWIEYVYSCLLRCSNETCREVVSNSGTGSVDTKNYRNHLGDWDAEYVDLFQPKFFEPHLILMDIPTKCSTSVVNALNESFKLFFVAPSAAANSVRIAIEELLTELKVKRFKLTKPKNKSSSPLMEKKRQIINLHDRIELIPAKHTELKEMLKAIKWIGNAGSHTADVITHDHVLDAYEFMEHVLAQIYSSKSKLTSLAKKINKNKGPLKLL